MRNAIENNEIPAIILLSLHKENRISVLVKRYMEANFFDFNLLDLVDLSRSQWKQRKFPIPKGYVLDRYYTIRKFNPHNIDDLRVKLMTKK